MSPKPRSIQSCDGRTLHCQGKCTHSCASRRMQAAAMLSLWCAVGLARFLLLCYTPDPLLVLFNIPLAKLSLPSLKGIPGHVCVCVWGGCSSCKAEQSFPSLLAPKGLSSMHAVPRLAGALGSFSWLRWAWGNPLPRGLGHVVLISLIRILYMAELLSSCKLA